MSEGLVVGKSNSGFALTLLLGAAALASIVKDHLSTPFDPFFDMSGEKWTIDPNLLRAIGRRENSTFRALVINTNKDGSRDIGVMQINERTARSPQVGVTEKELLNPQKNIDTAAKILSLMRKELGGKFSYHNWISAYNAGTPKVIAAGIINPSYVGEVVFHHQLYTLGRMFR